MSHFTTIQTKVKDVEALRAACAELGVVLIQGGKARGYNGQDKEGEYVIRLKGPYDIALNKDAKGFLEMTTDWWAGHVEKEVGAKYGRLLQLYGVHAATRQAIKKGYKVTRQTADTGEIKLVCQEA